MVHPTSAQLERFDINQYNKTPSKGTASNPSRQSVLARWGKPNKTRRNGTEEVWRYETGWNWAGVVPMLGIGIPLIVPVWPAHTDVYFNGDYATGVQWSDITWSGGYYGPADEAGGDYGFHALKH